MTRIPAKLFPRLLGTVPARVSARAAAFTLVSLASLAVKAQQPPREVPLAPAPAAQVQDLAPATPYSNEPAIAVNPRNPLEVVAAWQPSAGVAYSEDGGNRWTTVAGTAAPNYRASGDVAVTFDSRGHAILCFIAFDRLGTRDYWAHNDSRNGILVRRSIDGGKTWEPHTVSVIENPTRAGAPFEDKPDIFADCSDSRYAGNVYVGWTEFTLTETDVLFSRTPDGGVTWSAPVKISSVPGLPRDDNGALEGFSGAVGADGAVYAVWTDATHVVFTSSRDGGRTFARSRNIIEIAPPYFNVDGIARCDGFPQIACDPRSGRLYVTWSDYRNGDVDVFCSASDDRGRSWTPAVRVNTDGLHNGTDQFFQWMSVDPADGAVYEVFYDRRADPDNRMTGVTLARSTDHGRTFANYAWSQTPFDALNTFIGDYTGLAAYGGRVYGVWTQAEARTVPGNAPSAPLQALRTRPPRIHVMVGIADFAGVSASASER